MKRQRRVWIPAIAIWMILFYVCGCAETVVGNLEERFASEYFEYQGEDYRLKRRMTTVLMMGIDKTSEEMTLTGYRHGGQADFQAVAVIDENAQTVSVIQINRDTITPMDVLNPLGQKTGEINAQICLAFGFGDGGKESGQLACKAVSRFLNDVPIDAYYALNLDGISVLNDLLGGVEVTLEDDFSIYDPSMTKGKTLVLNGKQAEYYLRYRYSIGDESNVSRQKRQYLYMNAAKRSIEKRISETSSFASTMLETLEPYAVTNMTRGRMINLADKANRYTLTQIYEIEGESVMGEDGFIEFHPNENSLMNVVLAVFYEKR